MRAFSRSAQTMSRVGGHYSFTKKGGRGERDQLSVLCIFAPSVACCLPGSLIVEKGDAVLFGVRRRGIFQT